MFDVFWRCVLVGAGATALMDLWAVFLNRAFGIPMSNWGMAGRWFANIPRGTVFHADIGAVAPVANEKVIGWTGHYAIGILYAFVLVAVTGTAWLKAPTFLPAFIIGMVTVGAGWFLMQPGMGAGWAASKRANPMQVRALNIAGHTVFAIGLWGTALLIR